LRWPDLPHGSSISTRIGARMIADRQIPAAAFACQFNPATGLLHDWIAVTGD
jgi:hypothetical protein